MLMQQSRQVDLYCGVLGSGTDLLLIDGTVKPEEGGTKG